MTNWGAHRVDQIQWALETDTTGPLDLEPLSSGIHGQMKQSGLERESVVIVSQLVTIDKQQLTQRVGRLPKSQIDQIFAGIDLAMER